MGGPALRFAHLDDEELVARAKSARPGDPRAFNELVSRHAGKVRANCRYLVGDDQEAEDVAQEAFVRAYFGLASFEGRSTFGTWIKRIKVNRCLSHLKAAGRRSFVDVDDPGVQTNPDLHVRSRAEEKLEAEELRQRIDAALTALSDNLRVPLVLCDMDGMSYEEISETLGIGLSAVKMRIKRARAAFRQAWAIQGEQADG